MRVRIKYFVYVLFILITSLLMLQCKFSKEKQQALARTDSLSRDSTRKAYNPYKAGQGTQVYDQQRDALGNLDSLVTPK
jgi:hypothetical protein